VKVLPVDVRYSDWDCSLEKNEKNGVGVNRHGACGATSSDFTPTPFFSLRLGLRMVKGLAEEAGRRLVEARRDVPFADAQDLATRAKLNRGHLAKLAEAAALRGLAGHRHRARWEVAAVETGGDFFVKWVGSTFLDEAVILLAPRRKVEPTQLTKTSYSIRPPSETDDIRTDYASTGLTLGRHPIALMRGQLRHRRALTARELHGRPHGTRVRACGLVTMRQRPMTASGTIFITLEDETGITNVLLWARDFERYRREVMAARLMEVEGEIQRSKEGVMHLIARRVFDRSALLGGLTESRLLQRPMSPADGPRNGPDPRHGHPRNVRVLPNSRDFH
jgi:error-prone DNA polymerase